MPLMVAATAVVVSAEITRPRKLAMTLSTMARSKVMERVPTASAMAFAASVEPLTKIVMATSSIASASAPFEVTREKNSVIAIGLLTSLP